MKTANGNIQRQDENDDRATGAALPLVAIVGRPNVGKSTLFNRIAGQRRTIVGDEPGITRDRIYSEADWLGRRFSVVDTGGIVPDDEALIPSNILKQAAEAIAEAQVLIWVVDVRKGITSLDEELAALLRATGKPVLIAANKADAAKLDAEAGEFYRFGFEGVFPVSAEQGIGVAEMLDETVKLFAESAPKLPEAETSEDRQIKLAIVGRPNVGKSSLLNKLIGAERAIVSPEAGTTRDSVDAVLKSDGKAFRIIDTAGIRRKGKTREMAEKLSVVMARKALEQADVAVVIVDAIEGFTALDATIASYAIESGCSVVFAVNKWDAVEGKSTNTALEFERTLRARAKSFAFAPVITISALTGQRVDRILTLVAKANEARNRRIPTAQLNSFFENEVRQPSGAGSAKVLYMTQVGVRPPKFVLFTSGRKGGLHFSYERYLQNRLREEFDFFATPLRIVERHRKQK